MQTIKTKGRGDKSPLPLNQFYDRSILKCKIKGCLLARMRPWKKENFQSFETILDKKDYIKEKN